ncbi:MAG: peptidoglycan editing factor PgeF [Propionibacteriaceae bacterium]|jgi:YfiH family protein|nr:peptidoglycan editing factor PgeF [Propionibacteriaceae bacterium]
MSHDFGLLFTTRHGGVSTAPYDSWNLGSVDNTAEDISRNYEILAAASTPKIARTSQVHGSRVVTVTQDYPFWPRVTPVLPQADAMVTTEPGVALAIRVADCVPVLFVDTRAGVIGAVHAGREGLLAGVVEATIAEMTAVGATQIHAWIGPHICPGCYEVPPEMAHKAWMQIPETEAQSHHGTPAIDLGAGVEEILQRNGIRGTHTGECTSCDRRYFSYRRDQGKTGRQAGLIWLK